MQTVAPIEVGVLNAARFARRIPGSWRMWVIALPLFVATSFTGLAPSLLAALLTYLLWASLHPIASSYHDASVTGERPPFRNRSQRGMNFLATLIVIAALGIQAIVSLGAWIGESNYQLPEVVLIGSVAAILFAYGMFSMWWKFGYVVLTSAILLGAGSLGVWIALDHLALPDSLTESWGMNATRLLVIFLAAEWLDWLHNSPVRRRKGWAEHLEIELGLLTPACVVAFAFLAQGPGSLTRLTSGELSLWMTIALTTTIVLVVLWMKCRAWASRDFQWLQRRWSLGPVAAGPATIGLFATIALTPSLALAPIVSWPAWILVFGMGLFATLLKSWSASNPLPRALPTKQHGSITSGPSFNERRTVHL